MFSRMDNPKIAWVDISTKVITKGSNKGILNTAIKVALLFALDAMPATMVNRLEKPVDPKIKVIKNKPWFFTGLPSKRLKNR